MVFDEIVLNMFVFHIRRGRVGWVYVCARMYRVWVILHAFVGAECTAELRGVNSRPVGSQLLRWLCVCCQRIVLARATVYGCCVVCALRVKHRPMY